jgi:hypothetical protein
MAGDEEASRGRVLYVPIRRALPKSIPCRLTNLISLRHRLNHDAGVDFLLPEAPK